MHSSSLSRIALLLAAVFVIVAPLAAQTVPAQKTATEFYMEYQAAFAKAKKIEDLFPYMAAAHRKEAEAAPASDRVQFFQLMKMASAINVKVTKEERTSTGAILTAEGIDSMDKKKMTGKVQLVRENGAWKIDEESWTN